MLLNSLSLLGRLLLSEVVVSTTTDSESGEDQRKLGATALLALVVLLLLALAAGSLCLRQLECGEFVQSTASLTEALPRRSMGAATRGAARRRAAVRRVGAIRRDMTWMVSGMTIAGGVIGGQRGEGRRAECGVG